MKAEGPRRPSPEDSERSQTHAGIHGEPAEMVKTVAGYWAFFGF